MYFWKQVKNQALSREGGVVRPAVGRIAAAARKAARKLIPGGLSII